MWTFSFFLSVFPLSRQYSISRDDVWSLFLGRSIRQGGPQTVPADIPVCQRFLRLPLLLCSRLQYVPLLPHGVWLWVSSLVLFSSELSSCSSFPPQDSETHSEDFPLCSLCCPPAGSPAVSPPLKSKHMTRGYCNCLPSAHPHPLSGVREEGIKRNRNVCRNEPSTINEHLCILTLVWSPWLPSFLIDDIPSHSSDNLLI